MYFLFFYFVKMLHGTELYDPFLIYFDKEKGDLNRCWSLYFLPLGWAKK